MASSDDLELRVVRMPMLDTGIGREAGFRDDEHLREVAIAEREAMSPPARELADRIERDLEEAFINGTDPATLGEECADLITGLSSGLLPDEVDLMLEEHDARHYEHRNPPTRTGDPHEHPED